MVGQQETVLEEVDPHSPLQLPPLHLIDLNAWRTLEESNSVGFALRRRDKTRVKNDW